jgi:hypothetical protein
MATVNNFVIYKNEAIKFVWTMDPVEDISGWTFIFTIRRYAHTGAVLLQKSGVIEAPASNGAFSVSLTSAETIALGVGDVAYDIQRTNVGFETVLSIGELSVKQEVKVT